MRNESDKWYNDEEFAGMKKYLHKDSPYRFLAGLLVFSVLLGVFMFVCIYGF